jgi:8-oxo-dGTP diphosphatase
MRRSVRAIVLTDDGRILLCGHPLNDSSGRVVRVPPGGGIETGETRLAALRRELHEETGFRLEGTPPHVWHQKVVDAQRIPGYDGVINDFYLVRTAEFTPCPTLSDDALAAENISELRWWALRDIVTYRGADLFSPRALATLLTALLAQGVPETPLSIGD